MLFINPILYSWNEEKSTSTHLSTQCFANGFVIFVDTLIHAVHLTRNITTIGMMVAITISKVGSFEMAVDIFVRDSLE